MIIVLSFLCGLLLTRMQSDIFSIMCFTFHSFALIQWVYPMLDYKVWLKVYNFSVSGNSFITLVDMHFYISFY
jgi:hypothetical protein